MSITNPRTINTGKEIVLVPQPNEIISICHKREGGLEPKATMIVFSSHPTYGLSGWVFQALRDGAEWASGVKHYSQGAEYDLVWGEQ